MSENRFDKHINDEMSQLRIKPGNHVWAQVQATLRRKRRRRLAGFIIPVCVLALLGTYWWMHSPKEAVLQNELSNQTLLNDQNSTLNNPLADQPAIDINDQKNDRIITANPETTAEGRKKDLAVNDAKPLTQPVIEKKPAASSARITNNKSTVNNIGQSPVAAALPPVTVTQEDPVKEVAEKAVEPPTHVVTSFETKTKKETKNANEDDHIVKTNDQPAIDTAQQLPVEVETLVAMADSVVLPQKEKAKRKWKFGIHGSYGESGIGRGGFGESFLKSSMVYNSSPGLQNANYYVDKDELKHQSQKYYHAGLWANKPLTDRLSIQTGFDYQYSSTKTNVGWRVIEERFIVSNPAIQAAPVEYFYAPGMRFTNEVDQVFLAMAMPIKKQEFNNYWHMLSVPVQVNYLLTPVKGNYGISVVAGIRYQRMIAEEMLHFDEANGVMFRLNDLMNKNQFTLTSGLNFEFFRNNKFPVTITPNVGYQLNDFYKPELKSKHHAWMGALSIGVKLF
ncbi:RodZ family helix-turn-helix domain-containing protein [Gynurincola endophyticus]|uniref:hypothetical protein n=1 Tax=Gynurincola endophyticus TaxID=2479004 RepID=UPI000F8EADF7|nr:hypothetical protein [Gynurincola endophyticus]